MGGGKKRAGTQNQNTNKGNNITHVGKEIQQKNQPRNLLVQDATKPFEFTFSQSGTTKMIVVHQTPDENTWPSGALWDIGLVLAKLLVMAAVPLPPSPTQPCNKTTLKSPRIERKTTQTSQPSALLLLRSIIRSCKWKDAVVLELGCGVGLTGLVAATALRASWTILTDLRVVIDNVTRRNVQENTISTKKAGRSASSDFFSDPPLVTCAGGKIVTMPLCWGDASDEESVETLLKEIPKKCQKKKSDESYWYPDWIMIGDVAYHRPGEPSHFADLMSTVSRFVATGKTKVLFGVRIRMPASQDLLDMFRQQFNEVVMVEAHEIDPSLWPEHSKKQKKPANSMATMTVHLFQAKKETSQCE